MLEIGSIVDGKYKILNKIGQGGMSVVYLAMNERANKPWAIKEVRKDGTSNYEVVKQNLIAETDILKRLSHPNLPSIIDVIDREDTFLIVMDYIEGKPLSDALKREGAQPQEKVVEWAKQICDVLGYLHSRKPPIIYRDMKPSNVMLKPDGNIMIIDFGTAREYKSASLEDTTCLGTRGYAAPEQFGGHGQTDARTDIYCLGATLYHLLTGHNPCLPPYEMYPIRQWNASLSSGLEQIILKCTQQNPLDRYQSCAELMYALEHYDELDLEYIAAQQKKWKRFLTMSIIGVACIGMSVVCKAADHQTTKNQYNEYIRAAERAESSEKTLENYENAIKTDPSKAEAYVDMLDYMTEDRDFDTDEAAVMTETLEYRGSGSGAKTNADYFMAADEASYAEFAFDMGIAYYYYYNGGTGNKTGAQSWFTIAAESESLDSNRQERAKRLASIAGYYSTLGVTDMAGESETGYIDYWKDLCSLMEGNLLDEMGNETTALAMYQEMVYQISVNADKFRRDGVSEDAMIAQLDNAEEHLESDFSGLDSTREEMRQEILTNLESARQQVTIAFSDIATSGNTTEGGESDE